MLFVETHIQCASIDYLRRVLLTSTAHDVVLSQPLGAVQLKHSATEEETCLHEHNTSKKTLNWSGQSSSVFGDIVLALDVRVG